MPHPILDYESSSHRLDIERLMAPDYRMAIICGALPLLVGIWIFLLWLITFWAGYPWDVLMFAGAFTLYGGLLAFLIGVINLASFYRRARQVSDPDRPRIRRSALLAGALLLSNFPVALGIIVAAQAIETRYTVIIRNSTQQPLTSVRVFGGGCDVSFAPIPPGGVAKRSFWIHDDGELVFQATTGTATFQQTIHGYVTNGMGGNTTITVGPTGATIAIQRR